MFPKEKMQGASVASLKKHPAVSRIFKINGQDNQAHPLYFYLIVTSP